MQDDVDDDFGWNLLETEKSESPVVDVDALPLSERKQEEKPVYVIGPIKISRDDVTRLTTENVWLPDPMGSYNSFRSHLQSLLIPSY